MMKFLWLAVVVGFALLTPCTGTVQGQDAKPGAPIEYQPFYPDKWKEKKQATKMVPWEGNQIVLLTTGADFDGKVMARFLERLDAGWKLYADLIGQSPAPHKQHNGKATIAAVPQASYTCGMGCGYVGATGIEVGGLYKDFFGGPGDFDLVRKNPDVFAHYYFYEMGRNYFVFGDRHSAFGTGFAVFMRYVCMDSLKCQDPDKATRDTIDQAEAIYAESELTFTQAFINSTGLKGKDGKTINPTDANVMYASVMLRLRKDHGGDAWVKRYYDSIRQCPPLDPKKDENRLGQALYWVIAASLAAKQNLSPQFEKRWRFPLRPQTWQALKAIDWTKKGLTVRVVLDALPVDHLPFDLAVHRPWFLTPERKKQNLIVGGTFENGGAAEWSARSWRNDKNAVKVTDVAAKEGKRALLIGSTEGDDASFVQQVKVTPNTRYLLSGWVKTKGVQVVQKGGATGANLSLGGGYEASESIVGDADWTYVVFLFDSGKRTEVEVCARLGFFNSIAKGTAWFDDLTLVEVGKTVNPK